MSALVVVPGSGVDLWEAEGLRLGERERSAHSLMWDIGDWWNCGEAYGERAQIVLRPGWTGPKHGTCRNAASVAARFEVSCRHDTLSFEHHRAVAPLKDEYALPLLEVAENQDLSVADLRTLIKRDRREVKESELGEKLNEALPTSGRYGVIYADPPWQFAPWSRDTGMDRAADNHYPTMTLQAICELPVPAADDAVLFLWGTVPMLPQALEVMAAWGFNYRSHFVWLKDRAGTGYWNRNRHELLLVGTRGDIPAPAPGEQYASVIEAHVGQHSAKPPDFAEMIEDMYPHLPAIELFARAPRLGWTVWGAEAA